MSIPGIPCPAGEGGGELGASVILFPMVPLPLSHFSGGLCVTVTQSWSLRGVLTYSLFFSSLLLLLCHKLLNLFDYQRKQSV